MLDYVRVINFRIIIIIITIHVRNSHTNVIAVTAAFQQPWLSYNTYDAENIPNSYKLSRDL